MKRWASRRKSPSRRVSQPLQVVYGKGRIAYYIPSKETANLAQCACVSIPKHNDFLGLKSDDEVFIIAPK
jgi:hypothetical protein